MLSGGLQWQGPVVWWQPVEGRRHALSPELRPLPGQERPTLCGQDVTLGAPDDVDWLLPTCDECMAAAIERGERRRREGLSWESELRATARRLAGEP